MTNIANSKELKTRIIDLVVELKRSCILKESCIMEKFSISPAEYHGILAVSPGESISGGMLSGRMGLSVSRGSRVIDKLIRKGYFKQEPVPCDRRCMMVALASKGLKVKEEIDKMLDKCESEIKSKIHGNDLVGFINSLDMLTVILKSN